MDHPNSADLAHRVADAITGRTGRVWDEDSRTRLASWLDDLDHRTVADRWLAYVDSPRDVDGNQAQEFALRAPLDEALAGSSPVNRVERRNGGRVGFDQAVADLAEDRK